VAAHVACRPDLFDGHPDTGCFVVCARHDVRVPFGSASAAALAACREHNALHHADERRDDRRLLSVIYRSVRTAGCGDVDLAELLLKARHANRAFGVTGMLLAQDGRFLQVLEGPETVVRNLLAAIARDPRHEQVEVLVDEVVQVRRFPDWAMAEGHIGEIEALPPAAYYEGLLMARGAAA
jgi:hypothetical protein